ncbi:MAG TPA: serine hydrolase [Streptosporangiaceae bacterium]|jgi:hypothetical protein
MFGDARRLGALAVTGLALVSLLALLPGGEAASRTQPVRNVPSAAPRPAAPGPGDRPLPRMPSRTPAGHPCDAAKRALTERLESELGGARISVAVHERTTGTEYGYDTDDTFETASIAKVAILVTLLTEAQRDRRALTPGERSLAHAAIEYSDNKAADALWSDVGGAVPVSETLHALGLRHTVVLDALGWGLTRTTARDQVLLLSALTGDAGGLSEQRRAYALDLMAHVAPEQAWGVSAAAAPGESDPEAGPDAELKNGWLARTTDGGLWIINSIGRIRTAGHDYLIAVLSNDHPSPGSGIAEVERAARATVAALNACIPLPVPPHKPTR